MEYRKSYGSWAGNPRGTPPDFSRCAETVCGNERWAMPHQCNNKAKFDPDANGRPTTCKIHSAAYVAAKRKKEKAKYEAYLEQQRPKWHGPKFMDALIQIAKGHNDPRGLAHKVLENAQVSWQDR